VSLAILATILPARDNTVSNFFVSDALRLLVPLQALKSHAQHLQVQKFQAVRTDTLRRLALEELVFGLTSNVCKQMVVLALVLFAMELTACATTLHKKMFPAAIGLPAMSQLGKQQV
jgi:hypothetical protein